MNSTMTAAERQLVLDRLIASQSSLFATVRPLSAQQWHFREEPDRWSVAENVKHLIQFEAFITQAISSALTRPPEPEKQSLVGLSDPKVALLGTSESRRAQLKARETVRPQGQGADPGLLVQEFGTARARTLAFVRQTEAALHHHFFPHIAFGDLSCYQWLLVLGFHTDRHVLQIEQIQSHAAFPGR